MASVIPTSKLEKLTWLETHAPMWAASPAKIGLTAPQCTQLTALVTAARNALNAAQSAKLAAKAATRTQDDSLADAASFAQDLVNTIRAFAETSDDPAVYNDAGFAPPAPSTPSGPPQAPTDVVADPNADGTITLTWKGSTANQTFFSVWRKSGSGSFTQIGSVAAKTFVDFAVPAPAAGSNGQVQYYLRAHRGTAVSIPSDTATVQFGIGGQAVAA